MAQVLHGDCLELMKQLPDKSVDMILCDLPYGTTACKWDVIIPFEPLWEQYKRIIKPNEAIVLTASQPFTSQLVMSNPKWFKYEWIWEKENGSNFPNANYSPMKVHENILIFGQFPTSPTPSKLKNYNPQFASGRPYQILYKTNRSQNGVYRDNLNGRKSSVFDTPTPIKNGGYRYPRSVIKLNMDRGLHPTQKPVALFEYLIKTYTNEGDLILDNCAGSGTTAIAALNTGRDYILMEKEAEYIEVIHKRIASHTVQLQLAV
jgi:site-specific DNA-methyltransferase (adenine-specific)